MDGEHFILLKRYKVILKDGTELPVPLAPETCYYFSSQEREYLISALRNMGIEPEDIKEIITYFVPQETQEKVRVIIGV